MLNFPSIYSALYFVGNATWKKVNGRTSRMIIVCIGEIELRGGHSANISMTYRFIDITEPPRIQRVSDRSQKWCSIVRWKHLRGSRVVQREVERPEPWRRCGTSCLLGRTAQKISYVKFKIKFVNPERQYAVRDVPESNLKYIWRKNWLRGIATQSSTQVLQSSISGAKKGRETTEKIKRRCTGHPGHILNITFCEVRVSILPPVQWHLKLVTEYCASTSCEVSSVYKASDI